MRLQVVCALLVAACTPATTRPSFAPVPEALHAVINAPPNRVTLEAGDILKADTIPVRFASLRDAWLETAPFAGTYRLRLWADPDVPGKSRVTIEAAYPPIVDPSRTARALAPPAPGGSPGHLPAAQVIAPVVQKLC